MTKTNADWIDFGIGAQQVNSRKIPAHFSPENYIPIAVDGLSTSLLVSHLKGIDLKLGAIVSLAYSDQLLVSDGVADEFILTNPFATDSPIDVWFDGILSAESSDWERNASENKIWALQNDGVSVLTLPSGVYLRSRIYDTGFGNVEEHYTGNGVLSSFIFSNAFGDSDRLDVWYNGLLQREGFDWDRVSGTNTIRVLDEVGSVTPLPNLTNLRVRKYSTTYVEEDFSVSGVVNVAQAFSDSDKMDIYLNGRLLREGYDYARNSTLNQVTLESPHGSNDWIRIRIWI